MKLQFEKILKLHARGAQKKVLQNKKQPFVGSVKIVLTILSNMHDFNYY